MNREWQSFLEEKNARFDGGGFTGFSDPERESEAAANAAILSVLSDHALLRVHGADASGFLNNQLSNDTRRVDATHSQFAAWCNAKGRIIALMRVFKRNDDYYLLLSADLREAVRERLQRFVLRAKVTIENDDNLVTLGVSGPQADSSLRAALSDAPATVDGCLTKDDVTLLRPPGVYPRYFLVAPIAAARALWNQLTPLAVPVGPQAWTWLDIAAGVPRIDAATSEQFVPQMANLELLNGVDFKKGCYPGQEIVARMHYLGRLKQRMYRAHIDSKVASGMPVFAPDLPGQSTGVVVAAAASPTGGYDLLAVLHMSSAATHLLHLGDAAGPALHLSPLPYPLPNDSTSNEKSVV